MWMCGMGCSYPVQNAGKRDFGKDMKKQRGYGGMETAYSIRRMCIVADQE